MRQVTYLSEGLFQITVKLPHKPNKIQVTVSALNQSIK